MLVLLSYMFWAAPSIVPKESHSGDFLGELHDKVQSVCCFEHLRDIA